MFTVRLRNALVGITLLTLFTFGSATARAEGVDGRVVDDGGQPLSGANVFLKDTKFGSSTDLDGTFHLHGVQPGEYILIVRMVGYLTVEQPITIPREPSGSLQITLDYDPVALEDIIFKAERESAVISVDEPVRTEVIGQERLQENSDDGGLLSALSKQTGLNTRPCALCGSAGIGMQGLDPSYTEVRVDGLPLMSGLGALYGFDGISVNDLESVELVKGSGSDRGGAGAVAGSVNLVSSNVGNRKRLHINLAGSSTLQHTLSTSISTPLLGAASGRISLNYSAEPRMLDQNNDSVTDSPQYNRGSGSVSIGNPIGETGTFRIGGRYFTERRFAGVTNWTESDRGSDSVYGREIFTDRYEASSAVTLELNERDTFEATAGVVTHSQNSWYGITQYDADQLLAVSRVGVERTWSTLNETEVGFEYRYDQYDDNLQLANSTDELFRVPGLQLRHVWTPGPFWLVQGSLLTEHYDADGVVLTPRASLRFQPAFDWTFILAGGTGYRPVTIFSLDKAVHAGFDNVVVPNDLVAERNLGGSFTINHALPAARYSQNVDITAFYTTFRNKVVLSFGSHQDGTTRYTNAEDAFSRGVEISYSLAFSNGWSWNLSGTVSDVQYRDNVGWHLNQLQNRFTANSTLMKRWNGPGVMAEVTGSLFGPQALPEGRGRSDSPTYLILDLGMSKSWGAITLAGTVKNALDYVQPDNPLVVDPTTGAQQFDAAMIYGPLLGRAYLLSLSTTIGE
ncbi:TonB-dependent receptor [bacterium]|nr:TonB-dependent receptor [bacterium]